MRVPVRGLGRESQYLACQRGNVILENSVVA